MIVPKTHHLEVPEMMEGSSCGVRGLEGPGGSGRAQKGPEKFVRIQEDLGGSCSSKGVREGLERTRWSRRVLEGLLLKGSGRVQEGLGGSRMVLRRSRMVRESILEGP